MATSDRTRSPTHAITKPHVSHARSAIVPIHPCATTAYGLSANTSTATAHVRGSIPARRPIAYSKAALPAPQATSTAWKACGVSNSQRDSAIHRLKVRGRYWNVATSNQSIGWPRWVA